MEVLLQTDHAGEAFCDRPTLALCESVLADKVMRTHTGSLALRHYRERQVVLLVLFTLPDSEPRLRALHQAMAALTAAGLVVIAVPIDPKPPPATAPRRSPMAVARRSA